MVEWWKVKLVNSFFGIEPGNEEIDNLWATVQGLVIPVLMKLCFVRSLLVVEMQASRTPVPVCLGGGGAPSAETS